MKKRKIPRIYEPRNRSVRLIVMLALVIVAIAIVVVYSFAVRPAFNEYIVSKQVEAQDMILNALLSQLQQNGYIQIPIGDEVLTLVPYRPIIEQQETIE
jgi:hypothetical protein